MIKHETMGTEYACLFCVTGREENVVQDLLRNGDVRRATTARTIKRRTSRGVTRRVCEILLPGYVFVQADGALAADRLHQSDGVISVLYSMDGDWRLFGQDRDFAEWLFAQDGLLTFSKAYQEGDRVKIISGPLKELEGFIRKVDKRNTCGQVALNIGGREVKIWLGFDLVDKPTGAGA